MAEDPTRIPEPGAPRVDLASPVLVIGIGGAADALDSYERVFLGLPPTTDMAFVVVPHLDADHRGLMPSVLARCTSMPVVQVTEDLSLAANCVYVAPPGFHLEMADGTLQLGEPALAGAHVIDGFFTALADDQRNRAVGVVLSGTGSDGTQGVRAIRAQGGRVLVESPHTASDPAMPASAAATGLADDVLPAPDLAARIMGLDRPDPDAGRGRADPGRGRDRRPAAHHPASDPVAQWARFHALQAGHAGAPRRPPHEGTGD